MLKQGYYRLLPGLALIALLFVSVLETAAQEKRAAPELSVAGIKLGDRASGREFLLKYLPTTGEDGRPNYYFYNKYATQVMKVTAASFDDPYLVTEIEVFAVGKTYEKAHFFAEKIGHFVTEDRIFIGFVQSTASMLIGIPGVSRGDMIGPKDVAKKKGEPDERLKGEEERETFVYRFNPVQIAGDKESVDYNYTARYEFRKSKLKRFRLAISPAVRL
jgi:hypothetical protein